ncbi:MAG: hypothetical protein AAGA45_06515 [Verrucomicrobiota bacterium]
MSRYLWLLLALCLAACQTTPEPDTESGDNTTQETEDEVQSEDVTEPKRRPMDGGKYNRDIHRQTQSDLRRSRASYEPADPDATEVFEQMRANDVRTAFDHLRDQPDFSQVDVVAVPAQK